MNDSVLPEDDQPLRIKDVAAWLGVSDKTVRRLIDRLEISSVKIGGLRLILRRDIKAYMAKVKQTGGMRV